MTAARVNSHHRDEQYDEGGFSLIELVVAMVVMGIVLAMVTGAIVAMYGATSKVTNIAESSSQISIAVSKLDSTVRYADEISTPSKDASGNWTVAYRSTFSGEVRCTQLRMNATEQQLQRRSWTAQPASNATAWQPIASGVRLTTTPSGFLQPFTVLSSRDNGSGIPAGHQQLWLRMTAVGGAGRAEAQSATSVVFTAFNADLNRPVGTDDADNLPKCVVAP